MSELTIKEIKQKKRELQNTLANALREFGEVTGVRIERVDVRPVETTSGEYSAYIVEVELAL